MIGVGVWQTPTCWSYGRSSTFGELKAWCTSYEAAHAAYLLLSGTAEKRLKKEQLKGGVK